MVLFTELNYFHSLISCTQAIQEAENCLPRDKPSGHNQNRTTVQEVRGKLCGGDFNKGLHNTVQCKLRCENLGNFTSQMEGIFKFHMPPYIMKVMTVQEWLLGCLYQGKTGTHTPRTSYNCNNIVASGAVHVRLSVVSYYNPARFKGFI